MTGPELVLDVGLQQTGAGMLLRALRRLRPQLRRLGVGVVGHDDLVELDHVGGWRNRPDADERATTAFEREVAALVGREAATVRRVAGTARAVLVVSDQLLGRDNLDAGDERLLRPLAVPALAQVLRAVDPPRARVLLSVRRQDRLMEACYLRALQQGAAHDLAEHFPRHHEPGLDYLELIERIEELPEVAEVRVRPFELVGQEARRAAHDVVSALGLAGRVDLGAVGDDLVPYRLYSHQAAAIARDVNPHLESPRERRLMRGFLREHFPGTDEASTRLLAPDERRSVLEAHAAANRRLFEQRLPGLPPDAYASDGATARLAAAAPPLPPDTRARALGARAGQLLRVVARRPAPGVAAGGGAAPSEAPRLPDAPERR